MLKVFELFSGYGSQILALKKYGVKYKSVGISEIDKYAIQAHEALHGPIRNYGDITKLNLLDLPDADLWTYSFPCQDISMAGKQRGLEKDSGTRSSLLWECEKIIEWKRPKFLMMENVKNLVGKKNKPHFEEWLKVLGQLGYNNYWKVINAKWCGVPQNRERVFCVSIRKDIDSGTFKFYKDFDLNVKLKDLIRANVVACAIRGRNPDNPKSRVSGLPTVQMLEISKFKDVSNCITTVQKDAMLKNLDTEQERYMSGKEALKLMGVSDIDIDKIQAAGISNNQQYKMAGNSIVVDCMKFLDQLI